MNFKDTHKILYEFFSIIWEKTPLINGLNITIPDTIMIDNDISDWYFSDKNGKIMRRLRENVTKENIIKRFKKRTKGCQIAACFIYINNIQQFEERYLRALQNRNQTRTGIPGEQLEESARLSSTIEYFTLKDLGTLLITLETFLTDVPLKKYPRGILQAFVVPHGHYNSTI